MQVDLSHMGYVTVQQNKRLDEVAFLYAPTKRRMCCWVLSPMYSSTAVPSKSQHDNMCHTKHVFHLVISIRHTMTAYKDQLLNTLENHQYVWFGSCLERISGMPTMLDLTTRNCKVFKRSKSTRLCLKRLWVWIDSPCSRHLYISTSNNASERLCKMIYFCRFFLK